MNAYGGLPTRPSKKRKAYSEQSKAVYNTGQRGRAKDLSNEAKKQDRLAKDYHRQAKDYIFRVNNINRAEDEIDLHGLYVEEAKDTLRQRLEAEKKRGGSGIHVIVGKGNHSDGKVPKIKPAVEELCRSLKLQVSQEANAGRLYISISQPASKPVVQPTVHTPPVPEYIYQSQLQLQQQKQQQQLQQQLQQQRIPSVASSYVPPSYTVPAPIYVAPVRTYGTVVPQAPKPIPQQHVRPPVYTTPQRPPQNSYAQDLEAGRVDDVPQESSLSRFFWGIFGGISRLVKCIF